MTINSRTQSILETAIRDYIRTGKPVSSEQLCCDHDFGVRPATIRSELNCLIDGGFLMQPHTSAGRVPTDKGYRFLVDNILENIADDIILTRSRLRNLFAEEASKLVQDLAAELNLLGVGYEANDGDLHKEGLGGLFAKLDLADKKDIFEIISDFEMIDDRIDNIMNHISGQKPNVFIGKSPITKSRHLSVVADIYNRNGEQLVLLAIGPKRMNYPKVIQTFTILHQYE
ncbi:MAG: hypothetical protein Q8Q37_01185 [bacterium]|nr:hypothetical protein [bacterium]